MSRYEEKLETQNDDLKERLSKYENVVDHLIDVYCVALLINENITYLPEDLILKLRESVEFDPDTTFIDDMREKIEKSMKKLQEDMDWL